jgi:hypothetical protein
MIRFKINENFTENIFDLEGEDIHIKGADGLKGRMFGCVNIIYNYISIFGGIRDEVSLNDLWLINMETFDATFIEINKHHIYPRFGMSSITKYDDEEQTCRAIIYGGSYWSGPQLISGVTNELIVFNFKFSNENNFIRFSDEDHIIPLVYGKGSKRIYHQSVNYNNKMITFGGINNYVLQMDLMNSSSKSYEGSIVAYLDESILT